MLSGATIRFAMFSRQFCFKGCVLYICIFQPMFQPVFQIFYTGKRIYDNMCSQCGLSRTNGPYMQVMNSFYFGFVQN